MIIRPSPSLLAGATLLSQAYGQQCDVTTLQDSTPSTGNVVLQSFSYCGGTLNATAYITNLAYNKVVTLYYTTVDGQSTPLTTAALNYDSSIANTNYEFWSTSIPAWVEGITDLLNITYHVTDLGQTYDQVLNRAVVASGAPIPTLPSPPAPYATPKGFADDITDFLAVGSPASSSSPSEADTALAKMWININPAVPGAVNGVVVAGRSGPDFVSKVTDYEYDWVRDSSLTMNVVQRLYAAATNASARAQYETALFAYARGRAVEQNDPNLQTGLGEPKFYLNNTVFTGPWGRPQNDGPATAAITLIEFAQTYLSAGGSQATVAQNIYDSTSNPSTAPVQKDLLYVANNWQKPSFDLWEEEESDHFYTRMVQRKALVMGASFAQSMGDSATASTLQSAADALTNTLSQFWDQGRQILLYEYGPVLHDKTSYLDAAVPLGIIHGYAGDGVYSWTNDQVQSTIVRFATSFIDVFPLFNQSIESASAEAPLGIPIGRYPEDVYDGSGTKPDGGNPWYLTTAALAQYMYASSAEYTTAGSISASSTSSDFFKYFAPDANVQAGQTYSAGSSEFTSVIASLNGWGDAFMRTIKQYTPTDGSLTEEFNRDTGVPEGCADLTWSYVSVLTASLQRAATQADTGYVRNLANVGFAPN